MDNLDLNKFERLGQITEGCQSGQHLWDEREGHSTAEIDGELTKVKLRCLVCHKQFDISAPLGLNSYIKKEPEQIQIDTFTAPPVAPVDDIGQSDILKRLLG